MESHFCTVSQIFLAIPIMNPLTRVHDICICLFSIVVYCCIICCTIVKCFLCMCICSYICVCMYFVSLARKNGPGRLPETNNQSINQSIDTHQEI